jgi:hypothetical protein
MRRPSLLAAASKIVIALFLRTTSAAIALSLLGIDSYLRVCPIRRTICLPRISDTRFANGWKGEYRIDGDGLVYIDLDSKPHRDNPGLPHPHCGMGADRKISICLRRNQRVNIETARICPPSRADSM